MKDSLYRLNSDVLESHCTIRPFNVAGGVSFLLVLHLWYWGMRFVHHDVRIFVLQEVTHTMVKQSILGYIKCWPMWAVDDKLISTLAVVSHKVILWTRTSDRM